MCLKLACGKNAKEILRRNRSKNHPNQYPRGRRIDSGLTVRFLSDYNKRESHTDERLRCLETPCKVSMTNVIDKPLKCRERPKGLRRIGNFGCLFHEASDFHGLGLLFDSE